MLPQGLCANQGDASIKALLMAQPASKPFLYTTRNTDSSKSTAYGDLLNFIQGGDDDLRHLGVKIGEVVAYGAPPSGSATVVVAFLSIGAQTIAAPLAPGMTEPDVLDALDQFHAKHLILFEGVDNPGIENAFLKCAEEGKVILHRARIIGDSSPGLFRYIENSAINQAINGCAQLVNPENIVCLLLLSSGTTTRPKCVPL